MNAIFIILQIAFSLYIISKFDQIMLKYYGRAGQRRTAYGVSSFILVIGFLTSSYWMMGFAIFILITLPLLNMSNDKAYIITYQFNRLALADLQMSGWSETDRAKGHRASIVRAWQMLPIAKQKDLVAWEEKLDVDLPPTVW